MAIIYNLQDLYDKKSKNDELARYKKDLEKLHDKLYRLRKEVALTEQIIKMIEKEEIVEFREHGNTGI